MIGKKGLIILFLLSIPVILIIYKGEQLNPFVSWKFINNFDEQLPINRDLNNCILSFLTFHKLQSYLENRNQTLPMYLSFHSRPLRYDKLGKECAALFYRGQEQLQMAQYEKSCFYPFHITAAERKEIQRALTTIKSSFEKNNLDLVLTGGSFIGSWRYHQIIPYDDDIDFYIQSHEKPRIKPLLESLSENPDNRFVFKDTETQNQHWKLGIICQNWRFGSCKMQIDFFFMWDDGVELQFLEWPTSFKKSDYLPLRTRPFENIFFNVPKNFNSYMRRQYGSNYSVCVFKNHAEENECDRKSVNCDMLKYKYPYKLTGKYNDIVIELIVFKMGVQSIFIDLEDVL